MASSPASSMPAPVPSEIRSLFQMRGFRALLRVRLVGQAGDGLWQAGLASWTLFSPERAASPLLMVGLFAATMLPFCVVGPWAGRVLDRWSRSRIIALANAVRTLWVAGLALGLWLGMPVAWGLPAAVVAVAINRLVLTGLGASLPMVIPGRDLTVANALTPTLGTLAAAMGAGIGFAIRHISGPGAQIEATIVGGAALAYGLATVACRVFSRDQLGPDNRASGPSFHDTPFSDAVTALVAHRSAAVLFGGLGLHRLALGLTVVATVTWAKEVLTPASSQDQGLAVVGLLGVGTTLGIGVGLALTPWANRRWGKRRWAILVALVAVIATCVVSVSAQIDLGGNQRRIFLFALAAGAVGFAGQSLKILTDATLQEELPDQVRGRIFALYDLTFNIAFVLGGLGAALALQATSASSVSAAPFWAALGVYIALTSGVAAFATDAVAPQSPKTVG